MKYPGPVMVLKYCSPRRGNLKWNSSMRSIAIEIAGPNAAPSAVASPKTTDAAVRNEKGVTSARQLCACKSMKRTCENADEKNSKSSRRVVRTHRRLITLGAPKPVMALPIKHICMLL